MVNVCLPVLSAYDGGMKVTNEDVLGALRGVVDPELGSDIVELGMVASVDISEAGQVQLGIALTIAECPMRNHIENDSVRKVSALPGVAGVSITISAMTKTQRAELMSTARFNAREKAPPTMVHPITRVIAVGSGKGGVGKSTVSTNLAVTLAERGFRVGLLDADIWGFSIPRMLGTSERLEANNDKNIQPVESYGVRLVSTGLIVETEQTALMWRGLMLSKALEQFLNQVEWGELDYLVIDMPPGTGDIQMSLTRLLPQAEMVIVTTPAKTAQKVAVRVADMARRSFMPVIGVVENMSDFTCDHGTSHALFGKGGGRELAEELGIPLLGSVPLDAEVVRGGDEGQPISVHLPEHAASQVFHEIADQLTALLPAAEDETCTARISVLEGMLAELDAAEGAQAIAADN